MFAFAGRRLGAGFSPGLDAHLPLVAARFVLHDSVHARIDGVVASHADVASGMDARAELADEDIPGFDGLSVVNLDTAMLSRTVAAVARRTLSFFVRH